MYKWILIGLLMVSGNLFGQQKEAYRIYSKTGKKVSYKKMMKSLKAAEITFFGEYHNNPISHWLQLEVTADLATHVDNKLIMGFEMFESDQQQLLNDYLNNLIKERNFEDSCRLWSNYKTDYKPLINFAREKKIPCIADNIPRRLASTVFKKGRAALDSLDAVDYSYMCPTDFEIDTTLSQYRLMMGMAGNGHGRMNFVAAQAIKDATMAYFIDKYWSEGMYFVHYNGCFHTDFDQGIIWYLKRLRPELNYRTITTVEQADIGTLDEENKGRADFIICVPERMTKTH